MIHLLSELKITNFRSIKSETFEFSSYTPLVGYNNAGKSNILDAIKWLLRKNSLSEDAFNDKTTAVEIEGKITGINTDILDQLVENHRTSILPYLFGDALFIKRKQSSPSLSVAQIKLYIKDPTNIGTENEWKLNPAGIDQAIQVLFPDPIVIGAMEDSEEDVSKNKNTTTIGKLLAEIIGPIQENYSTRVQTALDDVKKMLDSNGTERVSELIDFDTAVNCKIDSFFPGVSIKVHIPTPELKEVFSKGTIKVFENLLPDGRDVSALGHGAQRSIQMALIRHLADIKKEAIGQVSNTILLIEEPELFLHPQAIEVLRDALKTLSTQGYQVIFSTHSPFMITSKDVENTLLIRKNGIRGTHKRNSLKTAISRVITEAPRQLQLVFSLSNSSNILFSEKVIIAEGTTENRLLPALFLKVTTKTLGLHKIALLAINGSGSIKKTISVLQAMDIPSKAIVDLDYVLRNGEQEGFLANGDTDVLAIKNHLASIAPAHGINLINGWPTKIGSTMTAAEAFAFLANEASIQINIQNLKSKLLLSGIWFWSKGSIEEHLNGISKDENAWAAFNSQLETSDLNIVLPNDHIEITGLINWMIS